MTLVQAPASEKDEEKGIWNALGRRLGGDWSERDVRKAEAEWSPQHPLLALQ